MEDNYETFSKRARDEKGRRSVRLCCSTQGGNLNKIQPRDYLCDMCFDADQHVYPS